MSFSTDADGKRWFSEKEVMWPGQKFSLQVESILHESKSKYQDILVFESSTYGRVLCLDGVIQITERDEHAYQEMIAHLPLFAHQNPRKVLIVGGGDGGVLREVVRHPSVESVVMCDIDDEVVALSKKYLGKSIAVAFDHPKATVLHEDAAKYIEDRSEEFDVIIVDSTDPDGPAESLYTESFYTSLYKSLRKGGIVCTQGECQWLHLPLIERVMKDAAKTFDVVDYAYTTIPTYPSGQIGFIIAAKSGKTEHALYTASRSIPASMQKELRYYSEEIHSAAFVLPVFAEKVIAPCRVREHRRVVRFASIVEDIDAPAAHKKPTMAAEVDDAPVAAKTTTEWSNTTTLLGSAALVGIIAAVAVLRRS